MVMGGAPLDALRVINEIERIYKAKNSPEGEFITAEYLATAEQNSKSNRLSANEDFNDDLNTEFQDGASFQADEHLIGNSPSRLEFFEVSADHVEQEGTVNALDKLLSEEELWSEWLR